jgi:hypothetical protein
MLELGGAQWRRRSATRIAARRSGGSSAGISIGNAAGNRVAIAWPLLFRRIRRAVPLPLPPTIIGSPFAWTAWANNVAVPYRQVGQVGQGLRTSQQLSRVRTLRRPRFLRFVGCFLAHRYQWLTATEEVPTAAPATSVSTGLLVVGDTTENPTGPGLPTASTFCLASWWFHLSALVKNGPGCPLSCRYVRTSLWFPDPSCPRNRTRERDSKRGGDGARQIRTSSF